MYSGENRRRRVRNVGCFDTKAGKMTFEQWLTAPEEGEHFGVYIYLTPRTRLGGSE